MPVTAGARRQEISQRAQYSAPGMGRRYWDYRDSAVMRWVTGSSILDAGCGEGITLQKLIARLPSAEITGIDVDPANVAICREHGLPATEGSIYDIPARDGAFDTCLLLEVIEHLENPGQALSELVRVTAPGGRILILYPVDWAMFAARAVCMRWREARFDPGHLRQWSLRELRRLLRERGCRIMAAPALPFPPPLMLHRLVVAAAV